MGCLAGLARAIFGLWRDETARPCPAFNAEAPLLRVVTALAEGADRMAARAALGLDAPDCAVMISCPLPFAREAYAKDFASAASKAEFEALLGKAQSVFELAEPAPAERAQNYLAAGIATLQNADVLLAVWNGKAATGKGGTGEIVERAANAGIPVLWINPSTPLAVMLVWPKRAPWQLAELSLERLRSAAEPVTPPMYAELVHKLCAPPDRPAARQNGHMAAGDADERAALNDYLTEVAPASAPLNDANWRGFFAALPAGAQPLAQLLEARVLPRYVSADSLASFWARRHRQGYVFNFVLAAFAVLFALISVPFESWKIYTTLAEVACIIAIIALTYVGQSRRWHARWIETRLLAEKLRLMLFLPLTGAAGAALRRPQGAPDEAALSWTGFYAAATQREIDLPNAVVDRDYVRATALALRQGVIGGQIAYHRHRAERYPHHEHRLHLLGALCIFGALAVSLLFLAARAVTCAQGEHGLALACVFGVENMPEWLEKARHWVPFLAGVLPAAGAAAYGVRLQSDFEGTQARSRAMLEALEALDRALEKEAPTMSFARLGEIAGFAADIMNGNLASWQVAFEGRPLALPG